jgi:hypothetical protein
MKRVVLIVVLMMVGASVSFGQATKSKTDKSMKASASANPVADAIIAKERQVLDALMKKDAATFNSLVASDAILNGPNGRMKVADFTKDAFGPDYTLSNSAIEDPQVMMIDKDAAILTYKSTGTETFKGQTQTASSYATSIWVKRGGQWKAIFHQESLMAPGQTAMNGNR